MIKKLLIGLGIVVFATLIMVAVNIIQNGSGTADGRTMGQILGIPVDAATATDVQNLSKSDIFQLFLAAKAPTLAEMNGEFKAELVNAGALGFFANWYSHNVMGPGYWLGKAFQAETVTKGHGYNLFKGDEIKPVLRTMRMETAIASSEYDEKPSMFLIYAKYNDGLNHSMKDEIRRINDKLYLGLGGLGWSGGSLNPAPFLLVGPPGPWVGADR